ncbi:polyprenyl synthetase family protein [uncultured Clostridium sp.]|jgi:geranylgeranyl diphosphate synthase type II|uniref:polyprenyl synthetase family protein n=1 Tax=uncultured Clostridium sp. TaxID=59620 RepID=UPI002631E230|nr:farnesyl diphosphate synthase [uncultured Clostridium sp.]
MSLINLKDKIDLSLKKYFEDKGSYNKDVYKAMAYSVEIGGKRVRPILTVLTYGIYKDSIEDVMPLAIAMEMIHTYSLIHDDLPAMDDDVLRRGKPTSHVVFGEALAILAGDALLNEAMNILFDYSLEYGKNAIRASKVISNAAGADGMIGGQVVDIQSEGKGSKLTLEELNYMHKNKTGALIKASILAGAIMAGTNDSDIKKLSLFGEKLGLAFQIKDDILDVTQTTEILGKTANSDIENEKTNYISLYGLEKCQMLCEQLTNECIELLNSIEGNIEMLKELTLILLKRKN